MRFWLPVLLVLCLSLFAISNVDAGSLIEIKKYKVINSQDVCGDNLCSPAVEQKAKKGMSTRDIKICGDAPCNAKNMVAGESLSKKSSFPTLKIESFSINNQNFLLFKGQGWHNLHYVEITMKSQTFETSVKSKTDDRGNLYMPWPIPKAFADGAYAISADDGIHSVKASVEISTDGKVLITKGRSDRCTSTKMPIDWSGCDLYGRVMTNFDLRMAKLKNSNLYGATLENMDLSGADLTNANLKEANLDGAVLRGADLSHSNMVNAKVRGADLTNAKMTSAKLHRTDFTKSNLENVNLVDATLSYSNLSFANLKGANLENAGTWAANLNHCKNHPICGD